MNILKLVTSLQKSSNSASITPLEVMTLSRTVKAMKSGTIQTVANIGLLPTTLTTSGNIYYVESEEDLYYNIGSTWDLFYNFESIDYAWGSNGEGRLGDGTSTSRSSPVTVVGGITAWRQLSSGGSSSGGHSLGLTTTGVTYAWGSNYYGQLGDGTTTNRSSPVTVVGDISTWTQVFAAGSHSVGITSTGVAYAWGSNILGQLGDNTTSSRRSPVTVVGGITNWSKISAGSYHSLALTTSGIAYAWGRNNIGQLGDNTTSNRSSPVTVVGGITNWGQISAGDGVLALTSGGLAYAWGSNASGQLGDNTLTDRSSPVTVVGGITNWSQISGESSHSLGITSSVAYAWGRNFEGQVGDNTTIAKSSPVTVIGGITNWSQVDAGHLHSVGLTTSGVAYAWGYNSRGRLGDNTTSNRSSPVTVVGGITNWSQISAGREHTLALSTTYLP